MLLKESFDELRVLHFKKLAYELSSSDIEHFLRRLGALNTLIYLSCDPSSSHRALAEFGSQDDCWRIMKSLHQCELFGNRITVEFGRYCHCDFVTAKSHNIESKVETEMPLPEWVKCVTSLSSKWLPGRSLSDAFYSYPKASPAILTNIVRCLASVSEFYVQTLHLMNRLNLPAPFYDTSEFPGNLFVITEDDLHYIGSPKAVNKSQISGNENLEEMDVSSGPESELSDDGSNSNVVTGTCGQPASTLRRRPLKLKSGLLLRLEKRLDLRGKPLRSSSYGLEDRENVTSSSPRLLSTQLVDPVFEPCALRSVPHIEMRLNADKLKEANGMDLGETVVGFGTFSTSESDNKSGTPSLTKPPENMDALPEVVNESDPEIGEDIYASKPPPLSIDAINAGKASQTELSCNPIFNKSAGPGIPSSRLYVKNLHKRTNEDDLWRVFGSFREEKHRKETPSQFSIQLLTGGRMKGQAFISLDSIELATLALKAVHGYVLNGKPMYVEFARAAIAKPDPNSLITQNG